MACAGWTPCRVRSTRLSIPPLCRGGRAIQAAFGNGGAFLGPALRHFDVDQTVRLFEAEGVATKVEGNGKIFPVSDRAVDVLEALLRRLNRSGAVLSRAELGTFGRARSTRKSGPARGSQPRLRDSVVTARRVILAVGGRILSRLRNRGRRLRDRPAQLGHSVTDTRPALVPIRVAPDWVSSLRGLSLPDVTASVHSADGKTLEQRREAILFAHFGLSGPADPGYQPGRGST